MACETVTKVWIENVESCVSTGVTCGIVEFVVGAVMIEG